ncbi:hypothetical protein Hdeb2414_s0009g00315551 [Helianthus debilis subsp. tardiflorus]
MAVCTVSIHVFGDVPSSPLVGVMQLVYCRYVAPFIAKIEWVLFFKILYAHY